MDPLPHANFRTAPASAGLPAGAAELPRVEGRRYAVVTPCRDEAAFARTTLDAVANQTERPARWVIVDDGSRDEMPRILAEFAAEHPSWVEIVTRADRGDRVLGSGVMEAFYAGLARLDLAGYDYLCKLDLDLDLPPTYFAELMDRMAADPRLGACSGKPYFRDARGQLVSELCGDEHAVGMSKFYRVACFEQIGGFERAVMWDGIDTHKARMRGWKVRSWDGPALRFEHLRPMGSSHKSLWTGRVRHGRGQYYMGTGPLYMLASSVFRLSRPPVVAGGLGMFWGYLKSAVRREPRYADAKFRKFLRDYQRASMFRGKRAATEQAEATGERVWQAGRPKAS